MSYNPNNPNGQATMANSQPVVIASNQSNVPTTTNGTIFTFSTVNSSTAQLASSATFTGTVESVVNQQSYSVLFFSDQNATITIKQYIDAAGAKLVQSLSYTYTAGSAFVRSGVLNGNYCNVVVQNTGGSTTTTLQLDTAYGTIPSATQLNNSPVSINEINGTSASVSSGATDAGTQRVMLANEAIQDLSVTGQAAQTSTVNNILTTTAGTAATDLLGYRSASVQIICPTGTYTTGAIIFEGANDSATGTNFQTIPVWNQITATGTPITAAITLVSATSIIYTFPVTFRYLRCRISTGVTGASASVQAISKFSQQNWTPTFFQVAQATAANLNVTPASTPSMTGMQASAAAADATANITSQAIRGMNHVFNGSTWDRQYGVGFNTTTGDTGAKTATGNGATQTNTGYKGVNLFIVLGAVTGTTPTCVFKLQGSVDGGTNWFDIPGATTASLTASTNVGIQVYPGNVVTAGTTTTGTIATANGVLPRSWRVVWTIGGTTPSFTITSISFNAIP